MPINIDNLQEELAVKSYSPQFFSSALTGNGKKRGLLCELRDPRHLSATLHRPFDPNMSDTRKRKYNSNGTEVRCIPLSPISQEIMEQMSCLVAPDEYQMTTIAHSPTDNNHVIQVGFDMHSVVIETTPSNSKNAGPSKKITIAYGCTITNNAGSKQPILGGTKIENTTTLRTICSMNYGYSRQSDRIYHACTLNPAEMLAKIKGALSAEGWVISSQSIDNVLIDLSCYDLACRQSELWQTSIDKVIIDAIAILVGSHNPSRATSYVRTLVRNIENYDIPLDLYHPMYEAIQKTFAPDVAHEICKANLNLLLSDTLHELDSNRHLLPAMPCDQQQPSDPILSPEQKRAVMATEPLVVMTAGAGTGKSHCVLARVDQMIKCGIDPDDILVLSFTNAATNHIGDSTNMVRSMTISSMIHAIYQLNFPEHELSTCETMRNSLDIFFKDDPLAYEFKKHLRDIEHNEPNAYTNLNEFVEQNYDPIIEMLTVMGQTTLELEIVICYQKIDQFNEPDNVKSKHIIIDETQDNSLFEFVYTWKYANKHHETLFVVGDANQTLFEFRGANAKALNVMEGSGIFACYKIETNYRSNQAILDFANIALSNIEANQYAHIQLHANDLTPVTEASFQDKVRLSYHQTMRLAELDDILDNVYQQEMVPYINECLARGEKVAFLAFQRKYVSQIEQLAIDTYGEDMVANLVPDKTYSSTIFSDYIRCYWDETVYMPTAQMTSSIQTSILKKLPNMVRNPQKVMPVIQDILLEWSAKSRPSILAWHNELQQHIITHEEFLNRVRESMLSFEIKHNAVKQAMTTNANRDEEKREAVEKASIIVSTIHSAKGLEFDNTIVLYRSDNRMSEDNKRLYYVALTRAKNTELIEAYDSLKNAAIVSDYKLVVNALHEREEKAAMASIQGI